MEEDTLQEEEVRKPLPFNNLFLLSGLVNGRNRFDLYLMTVLLTLFGYFSYQLAVGGPLVKRLIDFGYSQTDLENAPTLLFDHVALRMDRNLVLLIEMGMFVFGFMGLYIGVKRLHGKPWLSVLTGYERFRFRRFWLGFSVWGGMLAILTFVSWWFMDPTGAAPPGEQAKEGTLRLVFEPGGFIVSLLILAVFMPVQTGLEEVFFRGYLVQGFSQVFRNGIVPLLLCTLLFGSAHLGNPEVAKHGAPVMLTYYYGTALFLGTITLLDEGVELAWGLHLANNFISALLVGSPNSVLKPYTLFYTDTEDPQQEIVVWFSMAAVAFVIFWWKCRWKNLQLIRK